MRTFQFSLLILCLAAGIATATDGCKGQCKPQWSGEVFFDLFKNLSDDPSNDDNSGFRFRRAYLTYKQAVTDDFQVRVTLDAQRTVTIRDLDIESGAIKTDERLDVFIKYMQLEWHNLVPNHKILLGQFSAGTNSYIDNHWHYRSIGESADRLAGWTVTAVVGAGIEGTIGTRFQHHLHIANSTDYKHQIDIPEPDISYRAAVEPINRLHLSALYRTWRKEDYDSNHQYIEFFAGYDAVDWMTIGVQYGLGREGRLDDGGERNSEILSAFGRARLFNILDTPLFVLARYDINDPDTDSEEDGKDLLIAGFDWNYGPLHFQPNFQLLTCEDTDRDDDTRAVLTFYYKF